MAQKVSIILVDDLDGSDASETIQFALDGTNYEIDLNDEHAADLRSALSLYVGHARKVAGGRKSGRRASAAAASGPSAAEIRAWARENGHELSERGRVPAEVRQAYEAAH